MYNGRCPLCSGQLYEEGEILRCGKFHYQVERARFEQIWKDYMTDVLVLEKKRYDRQLGGKEFAFMRKEQAEQLLKNLQDENLLKEIK